MKRKSDKHAKCLAGGESSVTVTILPSIESSILRTLHILVFSIFTTPQKEILQQESEGTELSPGYSVAKI